MAFIIENLRLQELVAIVKQNQKFYEDFCCFLNEQGYADVHAFVKERSGAKAKRVICGYLERQSGAQLLDGLARPYKLWKSAAQTCLTNSGSSSGRYFQQQQIGRGLRFPR